MLAAAPPGRPRSPKRLQAKMIGRLIDPVRQLECSRERLLHELWIALRVPERVAQRELEPHLHEPIPFRHIGHPLQGSFDPCTILHVQGQPKPKGRRSCDEVKTEWQV